MSLEQPLPLPSRSALLAFLKVLADGEITCERSRQCLCEAPDFTPHEFYRVLQGHPAKGFVTVRDVHSWLSDQPHRLPRMLNEDVASFFIPYATSGGEMRYEGFLKMMLPRDDPALREVALNRNATGHWTHARDMPGGYISAETAYRVCRLFEEEIELARHLHFHRKSLSEQNVSARDVFNYLAAEKSTVSSIGYISQTELRLLLADKLGEFTCQQCEALFRRASVSSSGGLTYEDVVHMLQPHGQEDYMRALSPSVRGRPDYPLSTPPSGRNYRGVLDLGQGEQLSTSRPLSPRGLVPMSCLPPLPGTVSPRSLAGAPPVAPPPTLGSRAGWTSIDAVSQEIVSPRAITSYRPVSPRALDPRPLSPRPADPQRPLSPRAAAQRPLSPAAVASRPLSPRPLSPRAGEHALLSQGPDLQAVLAVIERQGQLDHHVEETKGYLPNSAAIESIFGLLDSNVKGYVTDTDLWQFSQKLGRLPFSSIFALIREIQNGRTHDINIVKGQLSLREIGALVLRKGTLEHEALDGSTSDHVARSALYVLRFTEPCPGCGIRIQRDADAAGCPNVTCPVCSRGFQCYTLMGDVMAGGQAHPVTDTDYLFHAQLPSTVQQDLFRIIEASAGAADEIEGLRKQLMLAYGENLLTETFNMISGGKHFFTFPDLRRALFQYKYWASERELELMWVRYARGADKVTLTGYSQQLYPAMGRA